MYYKLKSLIVKIICAFIPIKNVRSEFKLWSGVTRYNFQQQKYDIGKNSYLSKNVIIGENVKIGKYCSIGRDVVIAPSQHPKDRISTHPFTYHHKGDGLYGEWSTPLSQIIPKKASPQTIVGNDVWIGMKSIIQDGVTIGNGAIIGSGAIVTKDVPPYAIAAGVPARVIKYRFSQDIIDKLLKLNWWDYPKNFIVSKLPFDDIEKCIDILEKNKCLRGSLCKK